MRPPKNRLQELAQNIQHRQAQTSSFGQEQPQGKPKPGVEAKSFDQNQPITLQSSGQGQQGQSHQKATVEAMAFDHNEPIELGYNPETGGYEHSAPTYATAHSVEPVLDFGSEAFEVESFDAEPSAVADAPTPVQPEVVANQSQPMPIKSATPPAQSLSVEAPPEPRTAAPQDVATADDFLEDLNAILNGEKTYDGDRQQITQASPQNTPLASPAPTPSPVEPAQPAAPHDVFDRMAQGLPPEPAPTASPTPTYADAHSVFDRMGKNMAFANSFDLGTITLKQRFDEFDQKLDSEEKKRDSQRFDEFDRILDTESSKEAYQNISIAQSRYSKLDPKEENKAIQNELSQEKEIFYKLKKSIFIDSDFFKTLPEAKLTSHFGKIAKDFIQLTSESNPLGSPAEEVLKVINSCCKYLNGTKKKGEDLSIRADLVRSFLEKIKEIRQEFTDEYIKTGKFKGSDIEQKKEFISNINKAGVALRSAIALTFEKGQAGVTVYKGGAELKESKDQEGDYAGKPLLEICLYDYKGNEFKRGDFEGSPEKAFKFVIEYLESSKYPKELLNKVGNLKEKIEEVYGHLDAIVKFTKSLQKGADEKLQASGHLNLDAEGKTEFVRDIKLNPISDGLEAFFKVKRDLSGKLTADAEAELAYRALLVSFKGGAELWGGLKSDIYGNARITLQELSAELGWDVEAAIKLNAYADTYLKFGILEFETELKADIYAGVRCAGDFKLRVDPSGASGNFEITGFAGVKVDAGAHAQLKLDGISIGEFGIDASLLSGVGFELAGEFKLEAGKIKIQLYIAGALGPGIGLGLDVCIDPNALAEKIGISAYSQYRYVRAIGRGYFPLNDILEMSEHVMKEIKKFKSDRSKGVSSGKISNDAIRKLYCEIVAKKINVSTGLKGEQDAGAKSAIKEDIWDIFLEEFKPEFENDKNKSVPECDPSGL